MNKESKKSLEVEAQVANQPDPEVSARVTRRHFSAAQKRQILSRIDACGDGEIGAILREEGLYSSHIATWRKQRERGELNGLAPKKRGRKSIERNPLEGEVARLSRENARLQRQLQQAELIIDVQKKLSQVLGIALPPPPQDDET